jgi:hypothetical protein
MLLLSHTTASARCLSRRPPLLVPLLALAGDWIIYRYLNAQCHHDDLPPLSDHPPTPGPRRVSVSACIANGGNSWGISINGGVRDEELVRLSRGEHAWPYGGRVQELSVWQH